MQTPIRFSLFLAGLCSLSAVAKQPNILLMLSDDQSWSALGADGSSPAHIAEPSHPNSALGNLSP